MVKTSSDKELPAKKRNPFIWAACLISLYSALFIILTSHLLHTSPFALFVQFKNSLFIPRKNFCSVGNVSGVDAMSLFYAFLLPLLIPATAFPKFCRIAPQRGECHPGIRASLMTGLIGLLLFAAIQQVHRFDYFWEEREFLGETTEEKKLMFFGGKYRFVQSCRQILQGFHRGKLISDYDMETDQHMYLQRFLSYQLYPEVSLNIDNKAPEDTIIAVQKKDALSSIPKDYKVLLKTKDEHYLLALKDRKEK